MKVVGRALGLSWLLSGALLAAQVAGAERVERAGRSSQQPSAQERGLPRALQAALHGAEQLASAARGASGPARSRALELAAAAYDRCLPLCVDRPSVAARAAWAAAELWRRQGSPLLAEKGYLRAAKDDAGRFGQRGLMGAADMQRRQHRLAEAMQTYTDAERQDPRTSHAHRARLWMGRLVLARGEVDRAIERFQAALESAPTPRTAVDAADLLAKAWIQKGALDCAGFVLDHVDQLVEDHLTGDPVQDARLRRASQQMPARKALRRAIDKARGVAADAIMLDEHLRKARNEPANGRLDC